MTNAIRLRALASLSIALMTGTIEENPVHNVAIYEESDRTDIELVEVASPQNIQVANANAA